MTTATEIVQESTAVERASSAAGIAGQALTEARAIVVTADTYEEASDLLRRVKAVGKQIDTERKALTDPLNAVVKRIMDKFRPAAEAISAAESEIKRKLVSYTGEVERQRLAAEAAVRAAQQKEEERLSRLSKRAAARGDEVKAEEFAALAEQVSLAPAFVAAPPPTADGLSFSSSWSAEVTDLKLLLGAVLAGTVPAQAVAVDTKYLNATARATKGALSWPGVKWIEQKIARQRT